MFYNIPIWMGNDEGASYTPIDETILIDMDGAVMVNLQGIPLGVIE